MSASRLTERPQSGISRQYYKRISATRGKIEVDELSRIRGMLTVTPILSTAMKTRKYAPKSSIRRRIRRLERQLQVIEAEIARREKDRSLGLATQDHFLLWRRPNLFAPWSAEIQ
jgi:dsDNA-specific endonuclease/ATPase MutS2